ncbi:hypothetical protein Nepgr_033077 [Nepenthes gracilis]|uniref:Uncharacterized protein n=1 Tax=Nepenthes gracilis TaxID=150966 RepID=A0AAD3TLD3_NEPGR|nr:hypothetical protein Nepgr_033077 [Nepenthes gracilis]
MNQHPVTASLGIGCQNLFLLVCTHKPFDVAAVGHSSDLGRGNVHALSNVDPSAGDPLAHANTTFSDDKGIQQCPDLHLPCCSKDARVPEGPSSGNVAAMQGLSLCNPTDSPSCHLEPHARWTEDDIIARLEFTVGRSCEASEYHLLYWYLVFLGLDALADAWSAGVGCGLESVIAGYGWDLVFEAFSILKSAASSSWLLCSSASPAMIGLLGAPPCPPLAAASPLLPVPPSSQGSLKLLMVSLKLLLVRAPVPELTLAFRLSQLLVSLSLLRFLPLVTWLLSRASLSSMGNALIRPYPDSAVASSLISEVLPAATPSSRFDIVQIRACWCCRLGIWTVPGYCNLLVSVCGHVCDWEQVLLSNAADLLGVSGYGLICHARVRWRVSSPCPSFHSSNLAQQVGCPCILAPDANWLKCFYNWCDAPEVAGYAAYLVCGAGLICLWCWGQLGVTVHWYCCIVIGSCAECATGGSAGCDGVVAVQYWGVMVLMEILLGGGALMQLTCALP